MPLLLTLVLLTIIAPDFGVKSGRTTLWRSAHDWAMCSESGPRSVNRTCANATLADLAKGTTVELKADRESLCHDRLLGMVKVVVTSGASKGAVGCLMSASVQE